jgi:hypothetical protein
MVGDASAPKSSQTHCSQKRWFADDTIIRCVHWFLRFKLSYGISPGSWANWAFAWLPA